VERHVFFIRKAEIEKKLKEEEEKRRREEEKLHLAAEAEQAELERLQKAAEEQEQRRRQEEERMEIERKEVNDSNMFMNSFL
jgi:hypothetical protein